MSKIINRIPVISILGLVLVIVLFFVWKNISDKIEEDLIPSPQPYKLSVTPTPKVSQSKPTSLVTSYPVASEVNLAVPFTSQAPGQIWDEYHKEFCEEASVLMAVSYINNTTITNIEFADQKLFEIKDFEEKRFGYYKDTGAEDTAIILREMYKIEKVTVIYNPTIEIIKKALNEKKVIIIPAAGRQLGNPHYQSPGPLYHMLVIKGYTKNGDFITNDPGTRWGKNYIYSSEVIMNAIHDWNGGDVENGSKVMIVVG